jgi:hypothetical protein
MAKFELKFKDVQNEGTIKCEVFSNREIEILLNNKFGNLVIYLDKSTAIKFAKTLRTEINKITESEGELG